MLRSQDSLQIWRVKSIIIVRFGSSVFRQVIGIPMGTNSTPLLPDLFRSYLEVRFRGQQDITKAIQFSSTFRCVGDLFSINNVDFGTGT